MEITRFDSGQETALCLSNSLFKLLLDAPVALKSVLAEVTTIIILSSRDHRNPYITADHRPFIRTLYIKSMSSFLTKAPP
jgi:hypothetical protein